MGFAIDYTILNLCKCHMWGGKDITAHILVQYAKDLVSYVTWVNKDPIIIESVLTYNVLNLSSS